VPRAIVRAEGLGEGEGVPQRSSQKVRTIMTKYVLDSDQLRAVIEKAIDLFMDYQYKHGYDEPRARSETVMKIMETLRNIKKAGE
jgi:hypothetical protein